MPILFDPKFEILPPAQLEIWEALRPAARLGFSLYGDTAIALQLGHRQSVDFDFFNAGPLNKETLKAAFPFIGDAIALQDGPNTLVVSTKMPSGEVKVSFFGDIGFGRVNEPLQSRDEVMLVASLDDLLATKLKAILDRAEAKDYRDIAAMLAAGVELPKALSAFRNMFHAEPRTALMALGYFDDGDVSSISKAEKDLLTDRRDRVRDLPKIDMTRGSLVADLAELTPRFKP